MMRLLEKYQKKCNLAFITDNNNLNFVKSKVQIQSLKDKNVVNRYTGVLFKLKCGVRLLDC